MVLEPGVLALHVLFPPLDTTVLEPDFDLCLGELKGGCQIHPLRAHHVLLSGELGLQPLQLLRREDGPNALGFGRLPYATTVAIISH